MYPFGLPELIILTSFLLNTVKDLNGFRVYSGRSFVRFHSLERLQDYMLGDLVRLCFVHWASFRFCLTADTLALG